MPDASIKFKETMSLCRLTDKRDGCSMTHFTFFLTLDTNPALFPPHNVHLFISWLNRHAIE